MWWQANISNRLFDQKSPVHREVGFPRGHKQTDRRASRLASWFGPKAGSVKIAEERILSIGKLKKTQVIFAGTDLSTRVYDKGPCVYAWLGTHQHVNNNSFVRRWSTDTTYIGLNCGPSFPEHLTQWDSSQANVGKENADFVICYLDYYSFD